MSRLIVAGRRLLRDEHGGAMVETAFALPVFVAMVFGIIQFGLAVHANAGIQNALGEGARLATICVNPSATDGCSRPTDEQIIARIKERRFYSVWGTFSEPTVTPGTLPNGLHYLDLSVTYSVVPSFILVNGPTISFLRTKRVYLAT